MCTGVYGDTGESRGITRVRQYTDHRHGWNDVLIMRYIFRKLERTYRKKD